MRLTRLGPFVIVIVILTLAYLTGLFFGGMAFGFPEFVRHGYQGCVSCHVQPSGGGALTAYGRMISQEALSTWKGCGETCNPPLPEWVDLGLDYRYVNVTAFSDGDRFNTQFPMQIEAEGVLYPIPGLTLAASMGNYGPEQVREFRRTYVMVSTLRDFVRVRGGRFTPAFGVNDPDHTLYTRQAFGLGQGRDQYAGEAALITKHGELIVTHSWGSSAEIGGDERTGGYRVKDYEDQRLYARGTFYSSKTTQAGTSVVMDESGFIGHSFHGFASYDHWLYGIGEVARKYDTGYITYSKLGVEPFQGLHIIGTHEYQLTNRYGFGFQWFPAPGVDLLLRVRQVLEAGTVDLTGVLHLYL